MVTRPVDEVFPQTEFAETLARDGDHFRVASISRTPLPYGWGAHLGLEMIAGYDHMGYEHYQRFFDLMQSGRIRNPQARGWTDLRSIARFDLLGALNVKYLLSSKP